MTAIAFDSRAIRAARHLRNSRRSADDALLDNDFDTKEDVHFEAVPADERENFLEHTPDPYTQNYGNTRMNSAFYKALQLLVN